MDSVSHTDAKARPHPQDSPSPSGQRRESTSTKRQSDSLFALPTPISLEYRHRGSTSTWRPPFLCRTVLGSQLLTDHQSVVRRSENVASNLSCQEREVKWPSKLLLS